MNAVFEYDPTNLTSQSIVSHDVMYIIIHRLDRFQHNITFNIKTLKIPMLAP